ncbi:DUF6289 family protein [Ferrimonas aestuarii]|uniref:Uncharacterized protein n=1 Tax=Ferrimonas aestuarii TaxID=2569539 RepID=A0A4U1BMN1_9GAMM|nr:DUF6289 family protein [Ferrimonas aestuarii]TKB54550.1 hypothetical protein FCL42_12110 [Ferrimonas aestuarii]
MKNKTLVAMLLAGTAFAGAAVAAFYPTHYIERIYYETSAKKNEVGDLTIFCTGSRYQFGEQTPYYSELKIPCKRGGVEP